MGREESVKVTERAQSEPWDIPPSIPEKRIEGTAAADVVVVGSGIAGLTAALSAAEAGARTILLEKGSTFHTRGIHNAALASRLRRVARAG